MLSGAVRAASGNFTVSPVESAIIMKDELKGIVRKPHPSTTIVDARSLEEYLGKEVSGIPRPGHIPGAVHVAPGPVEPHRGEALGERVGGLERPLADTASLRVDEQPVCPKPHTAIIVVLPPRGPGILVPAGVSSTRDYPMIGGAAAVGILILVIVIGVMRRTRRPGPGRSHRPGPGAAGAVYELLNEDKRRAIEIIVEQRAEATDPERARANLPDLEDPTRESSNRRT